MTDLSDHLAEMDYLTMKQITSRTFKEQEEMRQLKLKKRQEFLAKTHKRKTNRKPGTQDNCETPPYALAPLFKALDNRNGFNEMARKMAVWEPACASGLMVEALRAYFWRKVYASDITPQPGSEGEIDFLQATSTYGMVITNPPWSQKYKWLKKCYQLDMPFALLVPVETLAAAKAHWLFDHYAPPWVIWMSPRVDFKMPNKGWASTSHIPTIWITHRLIGDMGGGNIYADISQVKKEWLSKHPECKPVRKG